MLQSNPASLLGPTTNPPVQERLAQHKSCPGWSGCCNRASVEIYFEGLLEFLWFQDSWDRNLRRVLIGSFFDKVPGLDFCGCVINQCDLSVLIPTPTNLFNTQPSSNMQPMTLTTSLTMVPDQIRRRLTDYDMQVRQGLEDGSIRQVMKGLSPDMVSGLFFYRFEIF